jgi:hypothetical protein
MQHPMTGRMLHTELADLPQLNLTGGPTLSDPNRQVIEDHQARRAVC